MTGESRVRTCLWFENDGLAAARFYTRLIANSTLETAVSDGDEPMIVAFSLDGVPYQILNGGAHVRPTAAASIVVTTRDQPETDRLWDALTANGGEPGRCGWLTDRWGVSWQIVPEALPRLLGAPDREAAGRARAAMMEMSRIDIAALESAARGGQRVAVETRVAAPLAEVWRAYVTPEDIMQWNAASDDWHTRSAKVDLCVGGFFSWRKEARDGSSGFDFEGVYTRIVEHERLEYELGDRKVEVAFAPGPDGITVRVTFDPETTHPIEQQRGGWQAILDSFARHVERQTEGVRQ